VKTEKDPWARDHVPVADWDGAATVPKRTTLRRKHPADAAWVGVEAAAPAGDQELAGDRVRGAGREWAGDRGAVEAADNEGLDQPE